LLLAIAARAAAADPETADRLDMVRTIELIARESSGGAMPTTLDTAMLDAMRRVPRHALVPAAQRNLAYANLPLRPRPRAVGLGHQRLRVGRGGCDGQPARHACRVHHRAGSCSQPLHRDAAPARAGPARGVSVQGGCAAREGYALAAISLARSPV